MIRLSEAIASVVLSLALLPSATGQSALTIVLVDGDKRTEMKYTRPNTQGKVGGVGIFTTVKGYDTLYGKEADVRTKNLSPQFEFWLTSAANPKSEVVLVRL